MKYDLVLSLETERKESADSISLNNLRAVITESTAQGFFNTRGLYLISQILFENSHCITLADLQVARSIISDALVKMQGFCHSYGQMVDLTIVFSADTAMPLFEAQMRAQYDTDCGKLKAAYHYIFDLERELERRRNRLHAAAACVAQARSEQPQAVNYSTSTPTGAQTGTVRATQAHQVVYYGKCENRERMLSRVDVEAQFRVAFENAIDCAAALTALDAGQPITLYLKDGATVFRAERLPVQLA